MLICSIRTDSALVMHPLHAKQSFSVTVAVYFAMSGFMIFGWTQFWEGEM